MRCCNIISDLITGVITTEDPEVPVVPQFLTFAFVPDPDLGGFLDWQFVGVESFDFCTFAPAYSTYFGNDSLSCFNGLADTVSYYSGWAGDNGIAYPAEADCSMDHTAVTARFFNFFGTITPPDMQITDALGNPVVPVWVVISPRCQTITFTVDDINDGCLIHAALYGYDDTTTYEFGSLGGQPPIGDPSWPAWILNVLPTATPTSIEVNIVGNQVTMTVENTYEFMRGLKWINPVTLNEGTAFFTVC